MTYARMVSILVASGVLTAVASGQPAVAEAGEALRAQVEWRASGEVPARPVEGAEATLVTTPAGAAMALRSSGFTPGHAVTVWWVVITEPTLCEGVPCSGNDVLKRTEIVSPVVTFADGTVVDADGAVSFTGLLASGSVPGNWFGNRFDDPTTAEVHLVLNDHGPLIPEIAASMLTSYRGGCRDDSLPDAFPATAKADGVPGPNTCRLLQHAIFARPSAETN